MCAVPQRHVRDLVREDSGKLAFGACVFDDAAVYVNEAAGQRERVDVRGVHDAEAVLKLRSSRIRRQPLSDAVDVRVGLRVIDDGKLLFCLRRRLLADLHVVLRREKIESGLDLRLGLSDAGV